MAYKVFAFAISFELREECLQLFREFDEFNNPDKLRAFTTIGGLEIVNSCILPSNDLDYTMLFTKLMTTGRSPSEPALFDLLEALGRHYPNEEWKQQRCQELKEKLRKELLQSGNREQDKDYEQLVESSTAGDGLGIGEGEGLAAQWMDAADDNLDELALRITLAVFNGTTFAFIERAKDDLFESLQQLVPPSTINDLPAVVPHMPLMRRLQNAGARETTGTPPNWKKVIEIKKGRAEFASEAIGYVWQQYQENKWRNVLIEWLTSYAVDESADVRTRVAVAVGILATQDYRFVKNRLLDRWVEASGEDTRKAGQYRMAIGMALGVLVREETFAEEVQNLVRTWSHSKDRSERWAAVRAYIYVGSHVRPISEVIERWREIAAFEYAAIGVEVLGEKFIRLNPLHISLMDAMMRFFLYVAEEPDEKRRSHFTGILEGLKNWIAQNKPDSGMGLFMFSNLGRLMFNPVGIEEMDTPPILLQLLENQPDQTEYRTQLAELFERVMSNGDTIIEARDLLCTWLSWINSLKNNSQSYEKRVQHLLRDIIAADKSGRMRGKLTNCLRDCGRNAAIDRIISDL